MPFVPDRTLKDASSGIWGWRKVREPEGVMYNFVIYRTKFWLGEANLYGLGKPFCITIYNFVIYVAYLVDRFR